MWQRRRQVCQQKQATSKHGSLHHWVLWSAISTFKVSRSVTYAPCRRPWFAQTPPNYASPSHPIPSPSTHAVSSPPHRQVARVHLRVCQLRQALRLHAVQLVAHLLVAGAGGGLDAALCVTRVGGWVGDITRRAGGWVEWSGVGGGHLKVGSAALAGS